MAHQESSEEFLAGEHGGEQGRPGMRIERQQRLKAKIQAPAFVFRETLASGLSPSGLQAYELCSVPVPLEETTAVGGVDL